MSDTPNPPEPDAESAPPVPDLLNGDEDTTDTDADATETDVADATAAEKAKDAKASKDSQRLLIAVAILVLVAVTAIGVGVARKRSSDPVNTASSSTSVSTTAPDATSTTKKGTPTTKAGAKGATDSTAKGGDTNGAPSCKDLTWPKLYTGKVEDAALKNAGVYMWNDSSGWHLRVVDPESVAYSTEIVSTANLDAGLFKTAGAGGKVTATGNKAVIELAATAQPSGVDFTMPCTADQFSVAVSSKGALVSPDRITVGKDAHAVGNPIVVVKSLPN